MKVIAQRVLVQKGSHKKLAFEEHESVANVEQYNDEYDAGLESFVGKPHWDPYIKLDV